MKLGWCVTWAWLGALTACSPARGAPAAVVGRVHGAAPFIAQVDLDSSGTVIGADSGENAIDVWTAPFGPGAPAFVGKLDGSVAGLELVGEDSLFAATGEGVIREWNWKLRQQTFAHKFYGASGLVARSPDGRYLAFGGDLFDRSAAREAATLPIDEQSALRFSADGARVVSAGFRDGRLVVRDAQGDVIRAWRATAGVIMAALSPRGDRVAAVLRGGEVRVWQLPEARLIASWWGNASPRGLSFLEDGTHVVIADPGGIEIRDALTSWKTYRAAVTGELRAFATKNGLGAAGTDTGMVWVWDLDHAAVLASAQASTSGIGGVSLARNAHRLAAADSTGTITVLGW